MYFCKIENFAYGEINERSFSNPTPGWLVLNIRLITHGSYTDIIFLRQYDQE